MDINWFEIVVTAFGVVLMMYFREIKTDVKTMSTSMTDMNIKLSTVITKHDNTEYVAKKNSDDLDNVRQRLNTLEGGQTQLLYHLEQHGKL